MIKYPDKYLNNLGILRYDTDYKMWIKHYSLSISENNIEPVYAPVDYIEHLNKESTEKYNYFSIITRKQPSKINPLVRIICCNGKIENIFGLGDTLREAEKDFIKRIVS